ncbi:MAG: chemotaxis protein CheX [Ethanoligenens sp.]|uniref:chemotaxis protein CheX n=1 Tax=Ethanoligenens sp. TaxID=2099655 RepID=UPI0039EB9BDF
MSMNENKDDSLFEATRDVFKAMLGLDISKLAEQRNGCGKAVQVTIGIIGELKGSIIYSFPEQTSLAIVNALSGMETEGIDDFVTSALAEISNIISGNMTTYLSGQNISCDILPPKIEIGDTLPSADKPTTLQINTSVGLLSEYITLQKAAE